MTIRYDFQRRRSDVDEANPPPEIPSRAPFPAPQGLAANVPMTHKETHDQYRWVGGIYGGDVAGTVIFESELGFNAKSVIMFNASLAILRIEDMPVQVPASVQNMPYQLYPAVPRVSLTVFTAAAAGGEIWALFTERLIEPEPIGASGTVTITGTIGVEGTVLIGGPKGAQTTAASIAVTQPVGATHHAGSVVTLVAGAGALAARATRTGGYIRARKANAANIVVDGTNLQPGDTMVITAIDAYAMTGTTGDIFDTYEEYN